MEKIIVVLCVLALSVTAYDGYTEMTGQDPFGFKSEQDEEGEDIEWSDIETVTVPDNKMRELLHFDHTIHLEFRWENKTSGEWGLWMLDYSGGWLEKIIGESFQNDGYGSEHKSVYLRRELNGQFTVFFDSSDGETVSSDGEVDVQRDEYFDYNYDAFEKMILTESNANLSVDQLQSTNIPLDFKAYMRSYFDPLVDAEKTLEEDIFEKGQTVTLGETGTYKDRVSDDYSVDYDWKAERGVVIAGYDTVFINVSTDFGSENFSIPFKREIWIANEVPNSVKDYIRTNTSWEGEEEAGYFLLENTWTLRDDGYTEGNADISWNQGLCSGEHWRSEHVEAELDSWNGNYMPKSGADFEESSFDFKTEDLIDFLEVTEPSDGLVEFLSDYPNAIITSATYNASKESNDPKAGEYWWNITFADERTGGWGSDERKRYRLLVYQETDFEWVADPSPHKEYTNEFRVESDFGDLRGGSPIPPGDVDSRTVTMASSEKIFKTEDKVMENFYTGPGGVVYDEISWGDGDETVYSLGSSSGEQGFGMDLIYTLTGIQTLVWEKYYWYIEKEDLMEGGTYASATVDAEDGRIVGVIEIDGTALQNALSFD
jgi:hypothetical protein